MHLRRIIACAVLLGACHREDKTAGSTAGSSAATPRTFAGTWQITEFSELAEVQPPLHTN